MVKALEDSLPDELRNLWPSGTFADELNRLADGFPKVSTGHPETDTDDAHTEAALRALGYL